MIVLRLGWRNLWRNPRRSLITISAVACGFAFLIILIGLMVGMAEQMLTNGTELLLGDVQLHHQDYLPERSLYDTLVSEQAGDPEDWLNQLSCLRLWTPSHRGAFGWSPADGSGAGVGSALDLLPGRSC